MIRFVCLILLIGIAFPLQGQADESESISITFVNPSRQGSSFWDATTSVMKAAAEDLNIDLKVVYASSPNGIDRFKHIDLVRQEAESADQPDYLVTHFRKGNAGVLLDVIEDAGLKTFIFNTDVAEAEQVKTLAPRQKYKNWIGHMYPDDVQSGYDMMEYLIQRAHDRGTENPDGKVGIFALSGNHHSVAAINRNIGLRKAIEDHEETLHSLQFARWDGEVAEKMTRRTLSSFPNLGVVWSANDNMVMGALDTIRSHNDMIVTGGMDWTIAALESIQRGELTVSYGGHFLEAAWALVMIHDYHHGKDFYDPANPKMRSFLRPIDRFNVEDYLRNFGDQDWTKVDFGKFSMVKNPDLPAYDFTLDALLEQMAE